MGTPTQQYYPQIDRSVDPKVTVHLQRIYPALNDHDRAIVSLNAKVLALQTAATATPAAPATPSSGGGTSPTIDNFTGLGSVNDETSSTSYTLQQSDSGAMLLFQDASAITVTLNPVITSPFFCFVTNYGTSAITLTATSPQTVNGGATYVINKNQLVVVVFSGGNWFASAYPIVPLDTPPVAHEWLASYDDTTGLFTQSQPDFTDLSGQIDPATQIPASGVTAGSYTNASLTVNAEGLVTAATSALSGTSASLGGSPLTSGQRITVTVAIAGAAVGMVAECNPQTDPGAGFVWGAFVSSANTVTVCLTCVAAAGTPTASVYSVRVLA